VWFIVNSLLLIAQPFSYRIAPYLTAARSLSLDVVIASRGEFSLISEVHQGIHIDFDDLDHALEQILDYAEQRPFVGVLGCDDSTVELAAMVAAQLNLPHNPPLAARLSSRKDLARAHLSKVGCKVPQHSLVDLAEPLADQLSGIQWPVVIKPLNFSASRGVIRADDIDQFTQACARIKTIISDKQESFLSSHLLVEEYIEGIEVAYEGYLSAGKLTTLALFDKPDPLQGPYFEETI
jgi:biotin carboxylase